MTYYIVDGTEECFYTAVFNAYNNRECVITSERDVQLELGYFIEEVISDENKAGRVKKKLAELDRGALKDVTLLLKSGDPLKENVAFCYVKMIMKRGCPVRNMLADPTVIEMNAIRAKVTWEIDKLKGLLRFMENAEGVLYAPYSPDADITDILARHFATRLGRQKFVIHDVKRGIAALYDGEEIVMTSVQDAEIYLSEYESYFENLWRQYYRAVTLEGRPKERQMKGYMPVRYWKFLPEKRDG